MEWVLWVMGYVFVTGAVNRLLVWLATEDGAELDNEGQITLIWISIFWPLTLPACLGYQLVGLLVKKKEEK